MPGWPHWRTGVPDGVVGLLHDGLGLLHRPAHAVGPRGQHDLRAEGSQHHPAFGGHGLRHGQHHAVAAGGSDHRQGDACVAGGALHDGPAGLEYTGLLRAVDDGGADAVLHRVGRGVELQLHRDVAGHTGVETVEPDQGGVADCFGDVVKDLAHCCGNLSGRTGSLVFGISLSVASSGPSASGAWRPWGR